MKKMRNLTQKLEKLIAGTLAVFMVVLSMSGMAHAATSTTITESGAIIQIHNTPSKTAVTLDKKTFDLYRVFDVTVLRSTEDDGTFTDSMSYAVNDEFYGFFDGVLSFEGEAPAHGTAQYNTAAENYVKNYKTDAADNMQSLVTELRNYVLDASNNVTIEATTLPNITEQNDADGNKVQTVSSEALTNGYYLIVDSEAEGDNTGLIPAGALVNVPARAADGSLSAKAEVVMKGSMPTIEKKVWHDDLANNKVDVSPTVGDKGSWDIVGDYQIGDVVEYRIKATIPSDLTGYKGWGPEGVNTPGAYIYTITDTLSDGITFNDDVKIYLDPTLQTEVLGKRHVLTHPDGVTFQIDFDMVGIYNDDRLNNYDEFYIYYTGTVTKDAVIAGQYEDNKVKLEYGNDPYDSSSKGEVEDEVQTYTFDAKLLKTEGDGVTPLAGAVFALYKIGAEGTEPVQIYLEENTDKNVPTYYPGKGDANDTVEGGFAGCITTDETGVFHIEGLNDATEYMLKEVEAPKGFNAADPIKFKINASYALNDKNISVPTITTSDKSDLTHSESGATGTIINTSSALLPTTGGMGTTMFMIVGGGMMLAALALLIVKGKKER